jgi:hypothetical protein
MDKDGNIKGPIESSVTQADITKPVQHTEQYDGPVARLEPIDEVADAIDRIDKVLCNMKLSDFADLKEARKVMKYRKKIATLKLELQDFLG